MSVQATDARLLLPAPARSAAVLGELEHWRRGLREVGIEPSDPSTDDAPDFVVAPATLCREAVATGTDAVILEGAGGGRWLRSAGFEIERVLPLPVPASPELLLPLGDASPVRYVLREWSVPRQRWKLLRNTLAVPLIARGITPPGREILTLALRSKKRDPFLVTAARRLGVPAHAALFLTSGESDALSRGAFHLFEPGADAPSWVLKFARVPGYSDPFDRDERGLGLAASAGGPAAAHAPKLVGRLAVEDIHASLETAAAGRRLIAFLHSSAPRAAKLAAIERIAGWIVEMATATASPSPTLEPELGRLEREVLPLWPAARGRDLLSGLETLPSVLQHNDLGTWNIVVRGQGFTALDWESARAHGLPLWDLWYFLAYATAELDGAGEPSSQEEHLIRLFRGDLAASSLLFRWTREAAAASRVPAELVGRLATLCWLHHGVSHISRRQAVDQRRAGEVSAFSLVPGRVAERWLSDPGLGPTWKAWRGSS